MIGNEWCFEWFVGINLAEENSYAACMGVEMGMSLRYK